MKTLSEKASAINTRNPLKFTARFNVYRTEWPKYLEIRYLSISHLRKSEEPIKWKIKKLTRLRGEYTVQFCYN